MKNYIIYNLTTGVIISTLICKESEIVNIILDTNQAIMEGLVDVNTDYIVSGVITHLLPEQIAAKNNFQYGYKWDSVARTVVKELTDNEITTYLDITARAKRYKLLLECDWTQTTDQTEATKLLWQSYRQGLRDVTSQDGFPNNIVWPIKPS